jgi:prophage maintenance system killer protein
LAGSQVFATANKRTAIALVNLLIVKSGYVLCAPSGSKKKISVAIEQISKVVGARKISLDALTDWYRMHIARSS